MSEDEKDRHIRSLIDKINMFSLTSVLRNLLSKRKLEQQLKDDKIIDNQ